MKKLGWTTSRPSKGRNKRASASGFLLLTGFSSSAGSFEGQHMAMARFQIRVSATPGGRCAEQVRRLAVAVGFVEHVASICAHQSLTGRTSST